MADNESARSIIEAMEVLIGRAHKHPRSAMVLRQMAEFALDELANAPDALPHLERLTMGCLTCERRARK